MSIINTYVNGGNSGAEGMYTISNSFLNYNGKPIAIRGNNKFIIDTNIPQDAAEELMFNIGKADAKYEKSSLGNMMSADARVRDIEDGNIDNFTTICKAFGYVIGNEDIEAIARVNKLKKQVREVFIKIASDADKARAEAELAALDERTRHATIAWDKGEGPALNSNVKGAGEGHNLLRLRNRKSGTKDYVETSGGERTTVSVVQRAWEFASEHWHGPHKMNTHETRSKSLTNGNYYRSGRSANVRYNSIAIGCQTISRDEAERFAATMGWKRYGE